MAASQIYAPKGLIHLEAKQSDLRIEGSRVTVGVHSALEDLISPPLRFETPGVSGTIVVTPSVGLFAARDLTILKNSQILASQDLREARASILRSSARTSSCQTPAASSSARPSGPWWWPTAPWRPMPATTWPAM
jgi:hypothetical protein